MNLLKNINMKERIDVLFAKNSVFLPISLGLILRVINIDAPIIGVHSWRQADTASIIRNFYLNGLSIAFPQVDWGGDSSGFVESEFPLYQYSVAFLYKIFGLHEFLARGFSIFCSCLTIFFLYRLSKYIFNSKVAWWTAIFYAFLPLSVYYGRTVQPESLMMLCSIICLERWFLFLKYNENKYLIFSWIAFTLAVLVKGLPLIWLGIPIFLTAIKRGLIKDIRFILCPILTLFVATIWFVHAHHLGNSTGLSFGLWGSNTGRYAWNELFENGYLINTIFRIIFRNLLVLGLPLLLLGFYRLNVTNLFILGIFSVSITGILNPSSFAIHEYYQLPYMIFFCPLIARGFVFLIERIQNKKLPYIIVIILFTGSMIMLNIDYWKLENPINSAVWQNSKIIKKYTERDALVVGVTYGDPTLLYLSSRKGWLVSPYILDRKKLLDFKRKGANYLTGSWDVVQSYNSFNDSKAKQELRDLICLNELNSNSENSELYHISCNKNSNAYLVPLSDY